MPTFILCSILLKYQNVYLRGRLIDETKISLPVDNFVLGYFNGEGINIVEALFYMALISFLLGAFVAAYVFVRYLYVNRNSQP